MTERSIRLAYLSSDARVPWGGPTRASARVAEMARVLAAEHAELLLMVADVAHRAPPPPPGVRLELLPAEPARTRYLVRRLQRFHAEALYELTGLHCGAGSAATSAVGIPHLVALEAPLPDPAGPVARAVLRSADLVLVSSAALADYARARGARRVKVCAAAASPRRARDVVQAAGGLAEFHLGSCLPSDPQGVA
jgi:hypothetical protein